MAGAVHPTDTPLEYFGEVGRVRSPGHHHLAVQVGIHRTVGIDVDEPHAGEVIGHPVRTEEVEIEVDEHRGQRVRSLIRTSWATVATWVPSEAKISPIVRPRPPVRPCERNSCSCHSSAGAERWNQME